METELGSILPVWSAIPFAGILLSIALFPLLAPVFWHHHYAKVSAAWSVVLAGPFVLGYGVPAVHELAHVAVVDYVPFIILISTLFTIGGGIYVRGSLRGSPATNCVLIAIGTVLASWVGTTGAAMLVIRPLLRANRARRHRAHTIVFFTFLVANIGGALTPLGDPPLFLGFLHGVPFFWTFAIWKEMLFTAGAVLGAYLLFDLYWWRREDTSLRARPAGPGEPIRVEGWHDVFFLGGVLAAVVFSGTVHLGEVTILGVAQRGQNLVRDAILLLMLAASWRTTPQRIRDDNEFTWEPIKEVAILFAGIFATIIPALAMLRVGEHGALAFVVRAVR